MPPPRVKPDTPVVEIRPPVAASPKACVSASRSCHSSPGWATTRRVAGSTRAPFIIDRSMTMPSVVEKPGIECEPPRTAISRPSLRASSMALMTSAVPAQRTTSAGWTSSNIPFQILRASS